MKKFNVGLNLPFLAVLLGAGLYHSTANGQPAVLSFGGQPQTGTISSAAQSNRYTFGANAKDVVDFTMVTTSGNLVPKIRLYNPDGTQLSVNYSGAPFGCSGSTLELNTVTLPATGTYTLFIGDCGDTNTGSYVLYAQRTNNPSAAAVLSFGGQPQSGTISSAAQSNSYTFGANAKDVVSFTMVTTSGNLVPKIRLYNPDGAQLSINYSGAPFGCSGSTLELNTVTVPAAGTYTVLFGDCGDTNTGNYLIYAQRTNNPAGAAVLLFGGQPQTGAISSAAQSNSYIFGGSARDVVNFTLVTTNGRLVPKIRLYNPDGTQLSVNYSGAPFGCSGSTVQLNNVMLPATGNYTVLIGDCGDTNTGSYNLSAQCIGVCTTVTTPSALRFVPVAPCRIADTRNAPGPLGGPPMAGGESRPIPVPSSSCGIPSTAAAYSINVTVVPIGPLGYLTLWPTGAAQPFVSTLNSDGRVKANAAIVPAGTGGAISVFVTNPTDVVIDINGYFVPATSGANLAFYPVTPCRIADTRLPTGVFGGPSMGAVQIRTFPVTQSQCGLPQTAQAFSLNYTVVPHGPLSYLTTWPAGQSQPFVSTLNSPTGTVVANAAIVPSGANGISVYVTDLTDLVIDVNGYFAPPGGQGALSLYTVAPCRVVDTRLAVGTFGGPTIASAQTRSFPISSGNCGIPSSAQAYSLNATVVPSANLGYLTLWPAAATQPFVSTLNSFDGSIVSNAAIVPAGNGAMNAFVTDTTDLVLDVNGYFAP